MLSNFSCSWVRPEKQLTLYVGCDTPKIETQIGESGLALSKYNDGFEWGWVWNTLKMINPIW